MESGPVSAHDLVEELRAMVEESSMRTVGMDLGLSCSRICDFLNGKRPLSRRAVKALGYDPTPFYRKLSLSSAQREGE